MFMKNFVAAIFSAALCVYASAAAFANEGRVVIVVTNHAELGETGEPTGYYLSEVAHPWKVFRDAGLEVVFASPQGGFAPMDPKSFDLEDPVNRAFWETLDAVESLATTRSLAHIDPDHFDAVFFAGGHGTMWDFPGHPDVNRLAAAVYEAGGVVGAVCHGPAALLDVKLSDGSYLVAGRQVGGFTNAEEAAVDLTDAVPFLLESRLMERGASFEGGPSFEEFVVSDGRLITGQNPASAEKTAEEIVALLKS
jgi:putative intracellular protease/amidase